MTHKLPRSATLLLVTAFALMGALCSSPTWAAHHEMDAATSTALDAAIAGDHRSDENKARDKFRRP